MNLRVNPIHLATRPFGLHGLIVVDRRCIANRADGDRLWLKVANAARAMERLKAEGYGTPEDAPPDHATRGGSVPVCFPGINAKLDDAAESLAASRIVAARALHLLPRKAKP